MDRVRVGAIEYDGDDGVLDVTYRHDKLDLPGIHAGGVRVAWGVLRIMLGLPDMPEGERAMAIAINAYHGWGETHGVPPSPAVAYAIAKHHRRQLLASGQGTPAEVNRQLARVRR